MLEDRGVERADVGEMPVKAAARYPQCFRQRLGLQGRETALSQRLEALIEPVLGGKLIGHFPARGHNTIHQCIDNRPAAVVEPYSHVWRHLRCATSCCNVPGWPRLRSHSSTA